LARLPMPPSPCGTVSKRYLSGILSRANPDEAAIVPTDNGAPCGRGDSQGGCAGISVFKSQNQWWPRQFFCAQRRQTALPNCAPPNCGLLGTLRSPNPTIKACSPGRLPPDAAASHRIRPS